MRAKIAALTALLLVASVAGAQQPKAKKNFAGTWVLDAAKSEGLMMPGLEQTMTVKQDGDKFENESKLKTQRGERTMNESFTADGKEGEFTMRMRQNETKGKRTVKWSSDGTSVEVNEAADIQTPDGGTASIKTTRKWSLSADGKTLTIEESRTSPRGEQKSKRVFNKQ